ncbi:MULTISPECIES: head decoration protein [unclassified Comamonas]|uniref:head decoration protein n=1 Tax=unclassified Comamonas TaxID=2638500 RepID=UPI001FA6B4DF|nr:MULTISPECIES: head decoration protein [unclassified Comamonas]UNV89524.1 head decoration protein [Comamonas sp. 7D-2evo1]UNV97177.1 head decoration protein [Comamonas sp. 7D-2]UNV99169.1 head decoration protein [Comamonas sp. 7D-2evo2]
MQVQELGPGTACYLVSESNGTRSREVVTIAQGQNLLPGAVLGKVTATGKYVAVDPGNGSGEGGTPDGSQTAVAVLFAAVHTTAAEKPGVITARDAEVAAHALAWPAGTTEPQKTAALAQLAAVGIVAR